ncbi:MAG: protein phosphatase 2C domain-containing protein [Kiritimatiellae bacterium]|nr:protein phosphatase 2C domain-containing protein [Kiritimatiellia bacterium]
MNASLSGRRGDTQLLPNPPTRVDYGSVSLCGPRPRNEDCVIEIPEWGVFGVCDGMGGHQGGSEASHMVADGVVASLKQARHALPQFGLEDMIHRITAAALDAAHAIQAWAIQHSVSAVGSTLAVLVYPRMGESSLALLHAGDSLAFRVRGDQIACAYKPHNLETLLGQEAADLPLRQRRAITRAIDHRADVQLDITRMDVRSGDAWMICTDGVSEPLDMETLRNLLRDHRPNGARAAAASIAHAALAVGGHDNSSAVVLYMD